VKGYHAKFGVPMLQLERTDNPPLFYALAVRLDDGWGSFLIISRAKLQQLWKQDGLGSENKKSGDLELYIRYSSDEEAEEGTEDKQQRNALCGTIDLTDYINAWESLPPLKPLVGIDLDEQEAGAAAVGGGGDTGTGAGPDEGQIEDIGPERPQA
jgi:hypothetical protein